MANLRKGPVVAPVRRSARQQSKEQSSPLVSASQKPPSRRGRPRKADNGSSDAEDPAETGRASRVRNREVARTKNLAPVVEESEAESDIEDDQNAARSRLSDATAVTSHSVTEIAEIKERSDDLASLLVELYNFSNIILEMVLPRQISEVALESKVNELTQPNSIKSRIFQKRVGNLDDLPYGSDNFIIKDLILRVLFNTDTPNTLVHADWRPDEILHKANLAKLARRILPLPWESELLRGNLQMLDDVFPQPFLSGFRSERSYPFSMIGESALVEATFAIALDIRTQLLHVILREFPVEDELDPHSVFNEIFLEGDPRESKLRGWSIEWPNKLGDKLPSALAKQWSERSTKLRKYFRTRPKNKVDFKGLEKEFPWIDFKVKLAKWIQGRNMEIDECIAQKGGVARLSDLLETARAGQDVSIPTTDGKHRFIGGTSGALKRMATWKQGHKSLDAQRVQRDQQVEDVTNDEPRPPPDSEMDADNDEAEQSRARNDALKATPPATPRSKKGRPANKASKPSLLDRQPDAVKVTWESQDNAEQGTNDDALFIGTANSAPTQAPPIVTQDEGFEEDNEGFETRSGGEARAEARRGELRRVSAAAPNKRGQNKNTSASRKDIYAFDEELSSETATRNVRKRRVDETNASPNKRTRKSHQQDESYEPGNEDDAANARNSDQEPVYPDDGPPSTNYADAQSSARLVAERHKMQNKRPQIRTPWTEDEINAFICLIERYGPSYSVIKDKDKGRYLGIRDQGALKDKARNMKVDYLMGRVTLPQNFDCIKLDKKAIEKLRSRGIDYEQEATRNVHRDETEG